MSALDQQPIHSHFDTHTIPRNASPSPRPALLPNTTKHTLMLGSGPTSALGRCCTTRWGLGKM
ncbi:hypothetical protein SCLCIDRAFT_1221047, partial [Scleroderma citrinum Foug A]